MTRLSLLVVLLLPCELPAQEPKTTLADWSPLAVPGLWEDVGGKEFAKLDGFAWYRAWVKVPEAWKGGDLTLSVDRVMNAFEAYWEGELVGTGGAFPPKYRDASGEVQSLTIPVKSIRPGQYHVVALRVYNKSGKGGFYSTAPALINESQAISLAGQWQFRPGDDAAWAKPIAERPKDLAHFSKVIETSALTNIDKSHAGGLKPAEAAKTFTVADDLRFDQVLAEPVVAQPVSISFDERGRLWVVQYLQYPNPAGLKMLSRDIYWRAVYDKVPPPPPHHFKGKDKITIHEDTDGDGVYDKHSTFVEGLSMTTAAVRGRGGVWVLNPPYLLFYPTKDNADQPTGDPEVHLSGFGLEDTHSITNSLRWGPDGWLYATQGSTVTAKVQKPGSKETVHSVGQNIWRYHPEKRRYEIFAEGGGNAFGVEFDEWGNVFSGHNGGNTRGFHYVQGGFYRKGFDKHGPLSNPYTFGFFEAMKSNTAPRFSHTFAINDAAALPEKYRHKLFGVVPLMNHIMLSEVMRDGSSLQTKDLGPVVSSKDNWFRPVDIQVGPDGALYVADWYDGNIAHFRAHEGLKDQDTGRIYRLAAKDMKPGKMMDLNKKTSAELAELLKNDNRHYRQMALRLLGDRKDGAVAPLLAKLCKESKGVVALNALWGLNLSGGFNEDIAGDLLDHAEPMVRAWTVRLLGDENDVSSPLARKLADLAEREKDVKVRGQLASSARRLSAAAALPIVRNLLKHDEDAGDIHVPLLVWWALESKTVSDRGDVQKLFAEPALYKHRQVQETVLPRIMRRYAQPGTIADLKTCAELFRMAPDKASGLQMLKGFEEAFKGRSVAGLPKELLEEIDKLGGGSIVFAMRLGRRPAIDKGLALAANSKGNAEERAQLILLLGEIREPRAVDVLQDIVTEDHPLEVKRAALAALQNFDDSIIGKQLASVYVKLPSALKEDADALLVSRKHWALAWLSAVDKGKISTQLISETALKKILLHRDKNLEGLVKKHWGEIKGATTETMRKEIDRLLPIVKSGAGSPYNGKKLFTTRCAACHFLHNQGGSVGPDLTPFKRDDSAKLLVDLINPSAEIREGFENHLVSTESGRVLTGVLLEKDTRVMVLRTAEGQKVVVPQEDVAETRVLGTSLMPEGLLAGLTDQEVRDLFAYLRSTQPLFDR